MATQMDTYYIAAYDFSLKRQCAYKALIIRALWDLADEIDQQVQSRFNACSAAHDDRTVSHQASALFKKMRVGSWVLIWCRR